jgi:hypothetical protein
MENLREAHRNARRGKSHYHDVQEVDKDPERYLKSVSNMLRERAYSTSPYRRFIKSDGGKEREIFVLPYYPDRIVQWAAVRVLEPIWMSTLIPTTYASLKGRGIHAGLRDLQEALRDWNGTAYCLKFDVRKFYPSVDHGLLKEIVRRKIKDPDVLWLLDDIIDSYDRGRGIPIGNYLSQFFGNLYLSGLDHWMKEDKRVSYYFRYCDDCVVLGADKAWLADLRFEAEAYLEARLRLTMKQDWQIFPTHVRGVDFLGYRCFGDLTLLRRETALRLKRRMRELSRKGELDGKDRSSIDSYKGWLQWCDGGGLERAFIEPLLEKKGAYT